MNIENKALKLVSASVVVISWLVGSLLIGKLNLVCLPEQSEIY